MFFVKKSSLFFHKGVVLQLFLNQKLFLAFYDYFDLTSLSLTTFKLLSQNYNFDCIVLSANFIAHFFKNKHFFSFLKPGIIVISGDSFIDFFSFSSSINEAVFFLIGVVFGQTFLNLFFFDKIKTFLNFSFFYHGYFFFLKLLYNFFYINYYIIFFYNFFFFNLVNHQNYS